MPQLESWAAILSNATAGDASTPLEKRRRSGVLSRRRNARMTSTTVDPFVQSVTSYVSFRNSCFAKNSFGIREIAITCVDSIDQQNVTTETLFEVLVNVTQQLAPTGWCCFFVFIGCQLLKYCSWGDSDYSCEYSLELEGKAQSLDFFLFKLGSRPLPPLSGASSGAIHWTIQSQSLQHDHSYRKQGMSYFHIPHVFS